MTSPLDRAVRSRRRGFTLIELMVVITIIAILMGAIFQMMGMVKKMNNKSKTMARLQRIQNAISGFYAAYGFYPPVPQYLSIDPWDPNMVDIEGKPIGVPANTEDGFSKRCNTASASQQVGFAFPPTAYFDTIINNLFGGSGLQSANTLVGSAAATSTLEDWKDVQYFMFGLLSFLVPRLTYVGYSTTDTEEMPVKSFFQSRQWEMHNRADLELEAQKSLEDRTTARWLPNLEKIVWCSVRHNGTSEILGVDLKQPDTDGETTKDNYIKPEGKGYVLRFASFHDEWDRQIYYYSPPPYQSYRLWSAGPDGKTFPPWIKIENLSSKERAWVAGWVKDDIVKGDQ